MECLKDFPEFTKNMEGYVPYYAPNEMFWFERDFDERTWHRFVLANWRHTVTLSAMYVILVFAGKRYMSERPKFDLRLPLAVWSGVLAVFSIAGMVRTLPELTYIIVRYGWEESVCNPCYNVFTPGAISFWLCPFLLSKAWELGDTAFIVLRKQPLIFLHWYHHVTVMIYTWWSMAELISNGRWFMTMNYTVHSLMYTYYCLRALRVPVPKVINKVITTLQLLQMVVGVILNVSALRVKGQGRLCRQDNTNITFSLLMYGTYFLLFAHFFYNAYLRPREKVVRAQQNGHVHMNGSAKTSGSDDVIRDKLKSA